MMTGCENQVMAVIWAEKEPMALAEIMDKVNAKFNKSWKSQTVSTFLAKIVRKGYLTSYRKGRHVYYVPLFTRDEYFVKALEELRKNCGVPAEDMQKFFSKMLQEKKTMKKLLPESENQVMSVIWREKESMTMFEIMDKVNNAFKKDWKQQTVWSFLTRIVRKGYLSTYKKGRYTYYVPKITRDEYFTQALDELRKNCGMTVEDIQKFLR